MTPDEIDALTGYESELTNAARAVMEREALSLPTAFKRIPQSPTNPLVQDVVVDPGGDTSHGARMAAATGRLDKLTEANAIALMDEQRKRAIDDGREPGMRVHEREAPRLIHRHRCTFPW